MNYLICEGKFGSAEYKFIHEIAELYKNENDLYVIECCNSNTSISKVFKNKIFKKLQKGDLVVLFFDCVESINDTSTFDILDELITLCLAKNCSFKYTTYYCFEELFLTYTPILDLIDLKYVSIVRDIQSYLYQNLNYKDYISNEILKDIFNADYTFISREETSASITSVICRSIKGGFRLEKGNIQDCWIKDCVNCDFKNKEYCCKECKYPFSLALDKVEDLDVNSISRISNPFSTLYDR